MASQKRFLVFGAHPDDPDIQFGGAALMLAKAGHLVKFVSVTNGECGHHRMKPAELVARRYAETQASAKIAGVEYQVLANRDAKLENTLAAREEILRIIRNFKPDVVMTHRLCDYHADHRTTSQLVMDTAFLVQVPNYCADTPVPPRNPVYAYTCDHFTDPRPIRPDAAIDTDCVIEEKFRLMDCHYSQFYEWLPWVDFGMDDFNAESMTWKEKRAWLDEKWGWRFVAAANLGREALRETYGKAGDAVKYAEVFELSPYGRKVSISEFRALFIP